VKVPGTVLFSLSGVETSPPPASPVTASPSSCSATSAISVRTRTIPMRRHHVLHAQMGPSSRHVSRPSFSTSGAQPPNLPSHVPSALEDTFRIPFFILLFFILQLHYSGCHLFFILSSLLSTNMFASFTHSTSLPHR
jgi:hypothetical protein